MKAPAKRLSVADQIRKGLTESIAHAKGEITLKTTVVKLPDRAPEVVADDLTKLRTGHRMSQAVFARVLNVDPKTVQSWEQGTRKPSQAALRLIQVFQRDPEGLLQLVGMTEVGSEGGTSRRKSKPPAKKSSNNPGEN